MPMAVFRERLILNIVQIPGLLTLDLPCLAKSLDIIIIVAGLIQETVPRILHRFVAVARPVLIHLSSVGIQGVRWLEDVDLTFWKPLHQQLHVIHPFLLALSYVELFLIQHGILHPDTTKIETLKIWEEFTLVHEHVENLVAKDEVA